MGLKKLILIILGYISLGLGAVGVALPVLPTTPFVLLAALCFSASIAFLWTGLIISMYTI